MSTENEVKPPSTNKQRLNMRLLNDTALQLFQGLSGSQYRGYEPSQVAKEAFALASVFVAESERIANGGEIIVSVKDAVSPKILIQPWDALTGVPMVDQETGQPVLLESNGDPWASAPNLSAGHPVNQAYFLARQALKMPIERRYNEALHSALKMREGRLMASTQR